MRRSATSPATSPWCWRASWASRRRPSPRSSWAGSGIPRLAGGDRRRRPGIRQLPVRACVLARPAARRRGRGLRVRPDERRPWATRPRRRWRVPTRVPRRRSRTDARARSPALHRVCSRLPSATSSSTGRCRTSTSPGPSDSPAARRTRSSRSPPAAHAGEVVRRAAEARRCAGVARARGASGATDPRRRAGAARAVALGRARRDRPRRRALPAAARAAGPSAGARPGAGEARRHATTRSSTSSTRLRATRSCAACGARRRRRRSIRRRSTARTPSRCALLAAWPDVVEVATRALEPHRIAARAVELAAAVHRWINRNRITVGGRPPARVRLALARCLRQMLRRRARAVRRVGSGADRRPMDVEEVEDGELNEAGTGLVDRLLLIGAWPMSCAAVYGLGFYTGSHTQERVRGDEERIVRLPVTAEPPPAGQRAKAGDDLTFWTRWSRAAGARSRATAIPAAHGGPRRPAVAAAPSRSAAQRPARRRHDGARSRPAKNAPRGTTVASAAHKTAPAGKTPASGSSPPKPRRRAGDDDGAAREGGGRRAGTARAPRPVASAARDVGPGSREARRRRRRAGPAPRRSGPRRAPRRTAPTRPAARAQRATCGGRAVHGGGRMTCPPARACPRRAASRRAPRGRRARTSAPSRERAT